MKICDLSLVRQFEIQKFNRIVDGMDLDLAKAALKDLFGQCLIQRHQHEELLKHQWGLDNNVYEQIKHDYNLPEVD